MDKSGKHNPNWKGGKIKLTCNVCGEDYFKFPSQHSNKRSKYCSKKCFYIRHPHQPVRDKRGYILIFKPNHPNSTLNGYLREHRYIIEKQLGRFLKKSEVVHHKNGILSDNRIENLELFKNHSSHMKHHHSKFLVYLPSL